MKSVELIAELLGKQTNNSKESTYWELILYKNWFLISIPGAAAMNEMAVA